MNREEKQSAKPSNPGAKSMLFQGWVLIVLWMSFGLLLDGFLAFKIPGYLQDQQRRELFRLAHTHGTLLGLILVAAALMILRLNSIPSRVATFSLRVGVVMMPIGFLLGGMWHSETDPGLLIWLVPFAALLVIFGLISLALTSWRTRNENS